ncbi:MAG: hypothetical protein H6Q74_2417 [Firmicutes bacterium]|nr:hypothetical protein [Bacillota bacterium]
MKKFPIVRGAIALAAVAIFSVSLAGICVAKEQIMPQETRSLITASYLLDGGTATESDKAYTAANANESGIYVENGGVLLLKNCTVDTTGASTDTAEPFNSSMWGVNAAIFANAKGDITCIGGEVTTTGFVAGGLFATCGGSIDMANASIKTTGGFSHGADATYGGTISLTDVTVETANDHASALATDYGGGRLNLKRVTATAAGRWSAGVYSDWNGSVTIIDSKLVSPQAEGGVIAGNGILNITNSSIVGGTNGLMIHNPITPVTDTSYVPTGKAIFTGGSLCSIGGGAILVREAKAAVTVQHGTVITSGTRTIVEAKSSDKTASDVTFMANDNVLKGAFISDANSSIEIKLMNGSALDGAIKVAALSIDATSTWTVAEDSVLTVLDDKDGISGTTITNIVGNGHNVYYAKDLSANSALGGLTYSLVNGGQLIPR